jgi:ribosomal protein S18 acetylase RimI-like enzyme
LSDAAIRRLRANSPSDVAHYWQTRNQGLKEFPAAFTTSYEEGLAVAPEKLAARFGDADAVQSDNFMLGAFSTMQELLGFVGFERESRTKQRHKAHVIGMYVVPSARGSGLSRRLLEKLINEARLQDGLEQLLLTVTQSNLAARQLYISAGFVRFGVEQNAIKIACTYYAKEYFALAF